MCFSINRSERHLKMISFPRIQTLQSTFEETFPAMHGVVTRAHKMFGEPWCTAFEETLATLFPEDENLARAVEGYVQFSLDGLRLHKKFESDRRYIEKSYKDVASAVYGNREYMKLLYLPGILLSHFLWPHHYRQRQFFESAFLPDMRQQDASLFFDVGIGTGYYSRITLASLPGIQGRGFDVSPHSKAYTEWQLERFGIGKRYGVQLGDITTLIPPPKTRWLISVEVLEHLEDPLSFLKGLNAMLEHDGKAFVTAAINAPNEDHIYLYRNVGEVLDQLNAAGFHVEQFHSSLAYKPRKPDLPVPEIAAFIVTPI